MNKTIIININGIIFHIEEDAYEVLKNYMTDVKRHFANSEDSLEITTDIENRIAEMFNDVLMRESRQVIVTADVNTIIGQMGTVEDFEISAGGDETETGYTAHQKFTDSRKLFRDPDDHLLGGVCAGIANYFDVQTVWIRIAFALAICFAGTGLMLYIILWIVVPKANNRSDRMAMKGEKLDLQGFKRNFEEELKNLHTTFKTASHEAKPFVYKARDFTGDFFHHFRIFLEGACRLFLKLLGVVILFACFSFFMAALIGLIALLAYGNDIYHLLPFAILNSVSGIYSSMLYFSAFIVVAIPLVAIITLTLKVVFNSAGLNRTAGYTMLIVWIGSLCIVIYDAAKITRQFKDYESFSQTINIKPVKNNTYHLQLSDIKFLTKEDSLRMNLDHDFNGKIILDDRYGDDNMPRNVEIEIVKSDVDRITLEEKFSAHGANDEDAIRNARNAVYNFTQKDSLLIFPRMLEIPKGKAWRDQRIELTLKVPYNTILVVDKNINYLIRNILEIDDCKEKNKQPNWTSAPFILTDSGLNCKVDTTAWLLKQPIAK
ncbi:PspC domain-containing protein [Mucilaginibacter sp. HMF5004]|uniref:PspC domain-containing protein n=1 Tax=Mucilaginibacter rivuli TaxID=2857527 RepID=UPI001C5FBE56|nr:PspC domain-containing protein [Mucilaginibacter rivuli]MBW4890043.1 PspC domain-containing protein [Mucilaginibacter rivuli]